MKLNIEKINERLAVMERNPAWLAAKVGVTRNAVSTWLDGTFMPKYNHLSKIGDALNVSWKTLIIKGK